MEIVVKNLSFTYDEGTRALKNINFYVKKGEFVGLLASNGSGKTTFLKALIGLLKSQEGEIILGGKNIRSIPARELYQKLGMVFQNPNDQLFSPTVIEDVAFGPMNLGLPEEEVEKRVMESLRLVDMEPHANKAIHHLSFGQQKRVSIAGVLAMQPEVLILDEPTAGLDPKGESRLMHLLNKLNKENGITIIMATHIVDLVPLFIDRLYILNRGEVIRQGTPEEVFSDSEVIERVDLRLPYISHLIEELKHKDGVPLNGLPLTIGEARRKLVELIPPELIDNRLKKD